MISLVNNILRHFNKFFIYLANIWLYFDGRGLSASLSYEDFAYFLFFFSSYSKLVLRFEVYFSWGSRLQGYWSWGSKCRVLRLRYIGLEVYRYNGLRIIVLRYKSLEVYWSRGIRVLSFEVYWSWGSRHTLRHFRSFWLMRYGWHQRFLYKLKQNSISGKYHHRFMSSPIF